MNVRLEISVRGSMREREREREREEKKNERRERSVKRCGRCDAAA